MRMSGSREATQITLRAVYFSGLWDMENIILLVKAEPSEVAKQLHLASSQVLRVPPYLTRQTSKAILAHNRWRQPELLTLQGQTFPTTTVAPELRRRRTAN